MDGLTSTDLAPRPKRNYDAERTRRNILDAARILFAEKGYSGANVNEIVSHASTTKPMIYYHFGSKEGLFAAVLEEVYGAMRRIEAALDLATVPPDEALRRLVMVTFDYHAEHPDWVRLISIANIHDAQHIAGSTSVAARNSPVIAILADLLARGQATGAFRPDVDPLHLHLLINAMCFYRVSNRHTWAVIFERDLSEPADARIQRDVLVHAILAFVKAA